MAVVYQGSPDSHMLITSLYEQQREVGSAPKGRHSYHVPAAIGSYYGKSSVEIYLIQILVIDEPGKAFHAFPAEDTGFELAEDSPAKIHGLSVFISFYEPDGEMVIHLSAEQLGKEVLCSFV